MNIEQYLQGLCLLMKGGNKDDKWEYSSYGELILKEGIVFSSQSLTKDELDIVLNAIKHLCIKPQMKECYKNAQTLSMVEPRLTYCEGLAMGIIPVNHAWNEINGKVIDITWRDGKGKNGFVIGEFPGEYMGLKFDNNQILKKQFETKTYYSFLDGAYLDGFKIFKNKFEHSDNLKL
jgi:hypothetical protein